MNKWMSVALLCAVGSAHADPSVSFSGFTNIKVTVVDDNPEDGITPYANIVGAHVGADIGVGPAGPASPTNSTTFDFDTWPTTTTTTTQSGFGAFAGYTVGPDSIMTWGSADSGSFYSNLTLSLDVLVSPFTTFYVSFDIIRGMAADKVKDPDVTSPIQAATDSSLYIGGGPLFGDGGPFRHQIAGNYVLGYGQDLSTSDRYSFEQVSSFNLMYEGGSIYERVRQVYFAAGSEGSALLAPIPEPSTYALMFAGLGAIAWIARRRRPS